MSTVSTPSSGKRLAALFVNFNSGELCTSAVQSVIHEWERTGRDAADLEIVVVDSASPRDQTAALAAIEALGARVIRCDENVGYARGMNLAFAETRGGEDDLVALLNPDLCFPAGSLDQLMDFVSADASVGLVAPLSSIDPLGTFLLPPNPLPTPREAIALNLAHRSKRFAAKYAAQRLENSIHWWTDEQPLDTRMLSGCCLLMRRSTVTRLGGAPMDPVFPLYFEDTDLCRRVSKLGLRVVHLPTARIIHHWSRSAGVGAQFDGEPAKRYAISEKIYFERYHGRTGAALARKMGRLGAAWMGRNPIFLHELQNIGGVSENLHFEWEHARPFVLEFAVTPNFILAAGSVGEGNSWTCPPEAFEWIFPGNIFVRAMDRNTREFLGGWMFQKTTPERFAPLEPAELERAS